MALLPLGTLRFGTRPARRRYAGADPCPITIRFLLTTPMPNPAPIRCRRAAAAIALTAALVAAGCTGAVDGWLAGLISAPASAVAARGGSAPMPHDPQTLMTRLRAPRAGDAERAERLAASLRRGIARYRDVEHARADGYRSFPPEPRPEDRIIHYVHHGRSQREADRIDATRPGALLYERLADGELRLVGAMFTAPVDAPLDELDRRVPLSVTQWHLHQNVCVPRPLWDGAEWARRRGGRPLYGPGSVIATRADCEYAGGRFLPTVFGWMAHVHVFAEDPAELWNAMYGHDAPHARPHAHEPAEAG